MNKHSGLESRFQISKTKMGLERRLSALQLLALFQFGSQPPLWQFEIALWLVQVLAHKGCTCMPMFRHAQVYTKNISLRVLVVFIVDPSLASRARIRWFTRICNSSSRGSNILFWTPKEPVYMYTNTHAHTCTHKLDRYASLIS